ncbi:PREDICTED: alpha-L-fucosidase 1 isoform X2 [Tarenaya hassleriana]|uniref:alpha-L-fucosidase 1 isoform X2 n=1 Tax=Tarenaya hassleriana TaxID=28532 RepID=UPI00053C64F7|nr:PREDICTED: alpha-L-fucosidase 1 isoform X2 [Tarenaya hassleriana]
MYLIFFFLLSVIRTSHSALTKPDPLPILPIPSFQQLQWQLGSMAMFLHFGPNTFTDSEWGSGKTDPSVFNPTRFNATQWVRVAKDSGFSRVILTAKHHDGFCLWPSDFTDYSVRSSPWRHGHGDVLAELAGAASDAGVGLGLYLSPWDRHEKSYGKTLEYNEYYLSQMTELLTRYGEIKEVWLDGAKGEGEKDMQYFFETWFSLIHQLQPKADIFSDAGPDVRWVGDEAGVAGSTCWSLFNRSNAKIGATDPLYSKEGDFHGQDWVPAECDVSIRPGWFWHETESPKPAIQLLDIYYNSVGRNCLLLLNVPPNSSGLISEQDIKVLQEFQELRNSIFSNNLARKASLVNASSTRGDNSRFGSGNVIEEGIDKYWAPEEKQTEWELYLEFRDSVSFNVLEVQEPIQMGQRIVSFHLEALNNGIHRWERVVNGTTVGFKRLLRFPRVQSRFLKLVVDKARADPLISYLGIYMDNVSVPSLNTGNATSQDHIEIIQKNNSRVFTA